MVNDTGLHKQMKNLIFIVNPAAKNGLSLRQWLAIEQRIVGIPYEVFFTQYEGHGTKLAKSVAKDHGKSIVIVAVGGDGTIHEIINGIIHIPFVKIAYIPTGSGNDFARGYKLPAHPEKSLEMILKLIDAPRVEFDAGFYKGDQLQSGYFINSLGAGFDAVISKKANRSPLKKWLNYLSLGKMIYIFYLLAELYRYRLNTLQIQVDEEVFYYEKVWFVTVSNQPFYGGGMQIAPYADPKDGYLNVVVVHGISKIKLLLLFVSVFWGGHLRFKEVATHKAKEINISFSDPVPIHADGEAVGVTPIQVHICPKSWGMIDYSSNH